MTFGDVDVFKKRGYMFTLRAAESNIVTYEMRTKDFNLFLRSRGKASDFKIWIKRQD